MTLSKAQEDRTTERSDGACDALSPPKLSSTALLVTADVLLSFAERAIKKRRVQFLSADEVFSETVFFLPTSDIVERLLSKVS